MIHSRTCRSEVAISFFSLFAFPAEDLLCLWILFLPPLPTLSTFCSLVLFPSLTSGDPRYLGGEDVFVASLSLRVVFAIRPVLVQLRVAGILLPLT
jgi:hypothetical protein